MDWQVNEETAAVEDEPIGIDEKLADTEEHADSNYTPTNIKEASTAEEVQRGAAAVKSSPDTSQSTDSRVSDEDSGYFSSRVLRSMDGAVNADKPVRLGVADRKTPIRRSPRLRQASTKADSNEISKTLSNKNTGNKPIGQKRSKSGNKNKVGKKGARVGVKNSQTTEKMSQTGQKNSKASEKKSRTSGKKPQSGRKKSQTSGNRSRVDSKTQKRVTSDSVTSPSSDSSGFSKSSSVKRKASELEAEMDGPITRSRRKMILDKCARSAKLSI